MDQELEEENGTVGRNMIGVGRHMEPVTGTGGVYWAGVHGLELGEENHTIGRVCVGLQRGVWREIRGGGGGYQNVGSDIF